MRGMKVKLAQWNVWVRGNARAAAEAVSKTDADIWCIQELTRNSSHNPGFNLGDFMISQLGYYGLFEVTRTETGSPCYEMGIAIYSRWPISVRWKERLQAEDRLSNPEAMVENRLALAANVQTPAGRLAVVSAHPSWQDELLRVEMPKFIEALGAESERMVVGCDANVQPNSRYIRQLNGLLMPAGPSQENHTWPTMPVSFADGVKARPLSRTYDYIFRTPDIDQENGVIIDTGLVRSASDHVILTADLHI